MQLLQLQELVRACVTDASLTYRQRVQRLAALAENVLDAPPVSDACQEAQAKGVVHDMGEGNAPYRPRYVLPDYGAALARGSAHLELPPPADLDEALAFLLAMYSAVPSITGYPVYLGDLDTLLEPYVDGLPAAPDDGAVLARLRLFWRLVDRQLPDAFVHADLGPRDGRAVRALLRVDRELRQVVPNLTLRVDPEVTPDDLLREAVLTACADGKPHFVNHPMMVADLGPDYGVVSCYNSLPRGGGAHTMVRLNLAESVRRCRCGARGFLGSRLPRDVALAAELIAARVRFLVERSGFYEHDWLVREGLVDPARFTAMFGVFGVAEAAEELLARDGVTSRDGTPARYGRDQAASDVAHALLARVAELVAATPVPHCEVSGGRALLHAQSGIDTDIGVTAGARVPVGHEPPLYEHIRVVAPNHRWFPAGVSDVFRFEPAVAGNPDAVVAVLRGAFAEGMRDFTFDVVGNGFTRVTGYLVRDRDVASLREAAAAHVAAIRSAGTTAERDAIRRAGRSVVPVPLAPPDGQAAAADPDPDLGAAPAAAPASAPAGGARHGSTFLGAGAIHNQRLAERVVKPAPGRGGDE